MLDRNERQTEAIKKWVKNKYRGTFEFATGFGKTWVAIRIIKLCLKYNPGMSITVVVPTDYLKVQWITELAKHGIMMGVDVVIINTFIKYKPLTRDLLIIDEIHRVGAETFSEIFKICSFKRILGLTATLERLDGKHKIIEHHCPVIDIVTVQEAIANKWLADYVEYKIMIDVEDIEIYREHDRKFSNYFSFFNNDFNLAMKCATGEKSRVNGKWVTTSPNHYRNKVVEKMFRGSDINRKKEYAKQLEINAFGFLREMQNRKNFILNHPSKIEITNRILSYRLDSKAITFSPYVKIAEKLKYGMVLSSKTTKKKNRITKEEFMEMKTGVLHTSKMVNEGADIPYVNLLIILNNSSSSTDKTQRIGRGIRTDNNPDKKCEIFTLILRGTAEENWFNKSNAGKEFVTLNVENLNKLLKEEEYETERNKFKQALYRF